MELSPLGGLEGTLPQADLGRFVDVMERELYERRLVVRIGTLPLEGEDEQGRYLDLPNLPVR